MTELIIIHDGDETHSIIAQWKVNHKKEPKRSFANDFGVTSDGSLNGVQPEVTPMKKRFLSETLFECTKISTTSYIITY